MKIHRVTSNGQVSLPAAVRKRWATRTVAVEDHDEFVVVRPVPDDPIAAARGSLRGRIPSTTALRARARRDAETAERRQR